MRIALRSHWAAAAVTALAFAGLAAATATPSRADTLDDLLDGATYRIHTTFRQPDGEVLEKTQTGIIGLPMIVNANNAGLPDLMVTLIPLPHRVSLSVVRLVGAVHSQLAVEVIVDLPGADDPKLAFGYDALESATPRGFRANAGFSLVSTKQVDLDVHVDDPGDSIVLTGELFDEDGGGERLEPKRGRAEFGPVPDELGFSVTLREEADRKILEAHADASEPTTASVDALMREGAEEQTLEADIEHLPGAVDVALDLPPQPSGRLAATYDASDRVEHVSVHGTERVGNEIVNDFLAEAYDLPTRAEFERAGTAARLSTDSHLGAVEVAFARGEAAAFPGPGEVPDAIGSYLLARDDDGATDSDAPEAIAAGVEGLRGATLDAGNPISLRAKLLERRNGDPMCGPTEGGRHVAGPFFVGVERGEESLEARICALPDDVALTLARPTPQTDGHISYRGSAEIGEIVIDATDPGGFIPAGPDDAEARATELDLTVRELPTELDLDLGFGGELFSLVAGDGQAVGEVEAIVGDGTTLAAEDQLTDGDEGGAGAQDGVIFRDRPDQFLIHGRVRDVERAIVDRRQPETTHAEFDTASGNEVVIDARQVIDVGERSARLVLAHLVPEMSFDLSLPRAEDPLAPLPPQVSRTKATYLGAAPLDELTVDIVDPRGIAATDADGTLARATELRAKIVDFPSGATFAMTNGLLTGKLVELDAGGGIGSVEVELSDGVASAALPPAADGVVVRDIDSCVDEELDRFQVLARITNLRSADLTDVGGETTVAVDAGIAGEERPLKVDVKRTPEVECGPLHLPPKTEFVDVTLDSLQPNTSLTLDRFPGGEGQQITYTADEAADSLSFSTNAGDRLLLKARLEPLPARLELCTAKDERCTIGTEPPREADGGSVLFDASEPTALTLSDCVGLESPEQALVNQGTTLREVVDHFGGVPPSRFTSYDDLIEHGVGISYREVAAMDPDVPLEAEDLCLAPLRFGDAGVNAFAPAEGVFAGLTSVRRVGFDTNEKKGGDIGHVFIDTTPNGQQSAALLNGVVDTVAFSGADFTASFGREFWAAGRFVPFDGATGKVIKEDIRGEINCEGSRFLIHLGAEGRTILPLNGRLCKGVDE